MSDEALHKSMTIIYNECSKQNIDLKTVITKAVQLGMDYQEAKIKEGIEVVFDSLHNSRKK